MPILVGNVLSQTGLAGLIAQYRRGAYGEGYSAARDAKGVEALAAAIVGHLVDNSVAETSVSVTFAAADAGTPLLVGTVREGRTIASCQVAVDVAFDGGASVSVGSLQVPGELQAAADNTPDVAAVYETRPGMSYGAETDLYVLLSGSPQAGSGRVIVVLA